jgi:hypothetical protein
LQKEKLINVHAVLKPYNWHFVNIKITAMTFGDRQNHPTNALYTPLPKGEIGRIETPRVTEAVTRDETNGECAGSE